MNEYMTELLDSIKYHYRFEIKQYIGLLKGFCVYSVYNNLKAQLIFTHTREYNNNKVKYSR